MIARRTWSFASPGIPSRHGPGEPGTTARDELVVRNEGEAVANVRMSMHHGGRRVDGYRLGVAPGGERSVRVNDLIFPEAVRLEEAYGLVWRSDQPVVVQLVRQDTRAAALAGMMATAWPG